MKNFLRLSVFVFTFLTTTSLAHEGPTNESGCHSDGASYHCHPRYGTTSHQYYTCQTMPVSNYGYYDKRDPRNYTYSCFNTVSQNRYPYTLNPQTYYGTPTYDYYSNYYGTSNSNFYETLYAPKYARRVSLPSQDQNTKYYRVPIHKTSNATLRNYLQWPYN